MQEVSGIADHDENQALGLVLYEEETSRFV
jgi:hypothetical protein